MFAGRDREFCISLIMLLDRYGWRASRFQRLIVFVLIPMKSASCIALMMGT
ncbi:hypothetical protein SAMN06295924_1233 [Rathayibacter rathayi NCPPB 2980 = VKM Ac-1601]|nr:hypothetical protein FB469_0672 [Rathayibacter rathayi]TWD69018.1 hypothetical protein FB469_0727 [Rathayibacter rathayi]SOE06012.1 hypothetical protein SAMN06295924_1233 [Rathayibacter rathayi NCPPB 2980 = VKM Ac-1601]